MLIRRGSEIQDPSLSLSLLEAVSDYICNNSERIKYSKTIIKERKGHKRRRERK